MKKVSIITPCYNDGKYLQEAVESARPLVESGFCEHIIVDDGSTEEATREVYIKMAEHNVKVIYSEKVGLGAARNIGIDAASADYYLNLDADNKIKPEYPQKASAVLDSNPDIGIIYSNYQYFGDFSHAKIHDSFDPFTLMYSNYIDSCAVIRKQVWKDVGGYDQNEMFWEDWNFWLSVLDTPWKFHHLNEILFYYRVREGESLRSQFHTREREVLKYIAQKHGHVYQKYYRELWDKMKQAEDVAYLKKLEEENLWLQGVVSEMEKSISWKITSPLRKIKSILRSRKT